MNKTVKAIASFMIVILIMALFYILGSYYERKGSIDTVVFSSGNTDVSSLAIPSGEYMTENENIAKGSLIDSIINESSGNSNTEQADISNEVLENTQESGEAIEKDSGDNVSDEIVLEPERKDTNQLVITSNSETSNQEKQQILTEIDEALKGLLEAVGKVETVDEEKLNTTLDSEVDGR